MLTALGLGEGRPSSAAFFFSDEMKVFRLSPWCI